ncbi:MAG: hypothetical protein CMH31_05215 [Micavibrio sp.]|nr:hypothetical protein [Micavibrio sp.]|tara:strand:- start:1603 stop:2151 length:549 start_codon:yes stop_codon:yes gene_type:complete
MRKITEKEQKNIIYLYGAIWASIIMAFIPSISFTLVATILFIFLLIAAYILRSKSEALSFSNNHATYIIRSIWFGIFILPALTLTTAIIYLLPNYDPNAMTVCASPLYEHILANPESTDMQELYGFIAPCMPEFMRTNGQTLAISGLIAILPILIYLLYRFGKGTVLAMKGKEINKPKSWII